MPARLLKFLFVIGICTPAIAGVPRNSPMESFVSTEKAFLWTRPGYSWSDCRPLEQHAPENRFKSRDDEALTMKRFNGGARDVCQARDQKKDLLSGGDSVELNQKEDGSLISETHSIMIGGELMEKRFYKVTAKGRTGWMSEDQITEPQPKEIGRPAIAKDKPYCPPNSKSANAVKNLMLQIPEIQNAVDKQLALAPPKSDREVDRYMCLYHDGRIPGDSFMSMYKNFQKSAKAASQAFGVPYGLIMCTMLTESGLYYNPNERKEYKGLPQFGSALVQDLIKLKARSPYEAMWDKFKKASPNVELTDRSVRSSPDPAAPAAAIALAYQWIYWDRVKQVGCKHCSIDPQINRKELYMMVTGYNWGPYSLQKVAGKTAAEMRSSHPPPKESRDYMGRMENCLERGYDSSFREEAKMRNPAESKAAKKARSAASAAKSAVGKITGRASGERSVYESRVDRCDRLFPVK